VAARKLTRRSGRDKAGRFLAEGPQAVREAIAWAGAGRGAVHEVFTVDPEHELAALAAGAGIRVSVLMPGAIAGLSETVTPQGVVAVCDLVDRPLDAVLAAASRRPPLLAVGADTADPGNAGTLIRVADAAGADAVVFSKGSVDPHNGKAVRASTGSLFHLPVVRAGSTEEIAARCAETGLRILAADAAVGEDVYEADLTGPLALLFGNDAHGLDPAVTALADQVVRVPIYGAAESLNLATAAAVTLYACARQRR
jgi:TrmH family RNA methyltransferase